MKQPTLRLCAIRARLVADIGQDADVVARKCVPPDEALTARVSAAGAPAGGGARVVAQRLFADLRRDADPVGVVRLTPDVAARAGVRAEDDPRRIRAAGRGAARDPDRRLASGGAADGDRDA